MVPDWVVDWFDNPIFMKHARSRLRRSSVLTGTIITLTLCLCIAWAGFQFNLFRSGQAFGAVVGFQAVLLGLLGATQVGTSIAAARASGILDFHRVSPLTPTEMALGFFFGAPIREYLFFLFTIPLVAVCISAGTPDFRGAVQVLIALVASTWVLQSVLMVISLTPKQAASGRVAVGSLVGLFWYAGMLSFATLFRSSGNLVNVLEQEPRLDVFGISLPWLVVLLLYEAPIILFAFLAVRRKLESERKHSLSKPQAVAAMSTASILAVGGTWSLTDCVPAGFIVLYVLVAIGILLTVIVTPTETEFSRGLLRSLRKGQDRPSSWADEAFNRPFLAVIGAVILTASTIVWRRCYSEGVAAVSASRQGMPLSIAVGTLVAIYFGLALQYFLARTGRRAANYFALFLFLVWVVPLLLGSAVIYANFPTTTKAQPLYALSPIAGIALASGVASTDAGTNFPWVSAAALTPTLLFAFVFNMLVGSAKRRLRRGNKSVEVRDAPRGDWELLDGPSSPPPNGFATSKRPV